MIYNIQEKYYSQHQDTAQGIVFNTYIRKTGMMYRIQHNRKILYK